MATQSIQMGNVHVIKSMQMKHACLGEEPTIAHLSLHTLEPHPHMTSPHDLPMTIGDVQAIGCPRHSPVQAASSFSAEDTWACVLCGGRGGSLDRLVPGASYGGPIITSCWVSGFDAPSHTHTHAHTHTHTRTHTHTYTHALPTQVDNSGRKDMPLSA